MTVVLYRRVSTDEQARSGLGLDAQYQALATECARQGWEPDVVRWVTEDDGVSSAVPADKRPALGPVLTTMRRGDVLVASRLDRLSRSVNEFSGLMERAQREGWSLVVLDLGVDTTTPEGELNAHVRVSFAHYERRLIAVRTREALAAKKRQGARLGRPVTLPEDVRQRIVRERRAGASLRAIAADLTGDGVPTAQGGSRWYPSTVAKVVRSVELDAEAAAAVT